MNHILIIIPTLDPGRGQATADAARASSGYAPARVRAEVIHDTVPDGFTKTVNRGLRKLKPNEDICFVNDDITAFQFGWLRALHSALYSQPSYGIAGPTGRCASPSRKGTVGELGLQVISHMPFWCVVIKRALFNKLGLLDERLIHYSSDTWYCTCAHKLGWQCIWVRNVFLWHSHQGSGFQDKWRDKDRRTLVQLGRERGISFSPRIPPHQR